jgi:hypothetical protein
MLPIGDLLKELERNRFYGSLEVKFESGKVVLIRKSETFKPTLENYGKNRGSDHVHKL